jgi:TP901 family phage tail tape measure protein
MSNSQNQTSWTYNANDLISPALQKVLKIVNDVKAKTGDLESKWGSSMTNMKQKVEQFKAANSEAFQTVLNEVPGLDRALNMLTNPYVLGAAAAATFGAAAIGATSQSLTWEAAIAKANVTAQKSGAELEAMDMRMRQMAATSSVEFNQVPEAFTRIISSVGDADKSFAILEPTLKAAKASFTDVTLVAGAATNVMNSIKGATPERVFDVLFATLNKGNAEFKDIANYLPKLLPFANNVGFSLEEAAGAWALFTAKGQSSEAATTGLQNAFRALANKDRIEDLKVMGIEIFDLQGKTRPLTSIIQDLNREFDGLTDAQRVDKLGKLGLDAEAASAFSIMSMNAQDLTGFIDATTNSMGALNQAVDFGKNKLADWQQVKNEIMVTLIMPLGDTFLPLVAMLTRGISLTVGAIRQIPEAATQAWEVLEPILVVATMGIAGWTAGWAYYNTTLILSTIVTNAAAVAIGLKSTAVGIATAATWLWTEAQIALGVAMSANPIGLIIAGIAALTAGIYYAYQNSQTFRAALSGIWEVIKSLLPLLFNAWKLLYQMVTLDFSGMVDTMTDTYNSITSIRDNFNKGFDAQITTERNERVNQIIETKQNQSFNATPAGQVGMDLMGFNIPKPNIPVYSSPIIAPTSAQKPPENNINTQLASVAGSNNQSAGNKDGISISGSGSGGGKSLTIRIERMIGVEKLTLNSIAEGTEDIGKALLQQLMMAIAQAEGTV